MSACTGHTLQALNRWLRDVASGSDLQFVVAPCSTYKLCISRRTHALYVADGASPWVVFPVALLRRTCNCAPPALSVANFSKSAHLHLILC